MCFFHVKLVSIVNPKKLNSSTFSMLMPSIFNVRCCICKSSKFNVEVGLHQGSALSPYLFLILMDVLTERVRKEAPESMLFADDIVLCGDKDVDMTEYLE